MAKIRFWMLSIFTVSLFLVSCGGDVDESAVLTKYLESADSPIDVASIAKYITASDVQTLIATDAAYIVDVRSAADFATIGHIAGAHNVAAGDVITHLDAADLTGIDKIVICCYTGQTAAFVTSLVRLAGYDNAVSLKWGMSSWNAACASSLNSNSKNTYETQLVTDDNPKGEEGALPVLSTGLETAEEILEAQISEVMASGFGEAAVSADVVFANPDDYYIINYWNADHYALGHVPGAIQYTPNEDLQLDTFLKTVPADKTVVIYCYTGQTSAFMAAYMKVLGYDCKSLKFGINGMATDWAGDNGLTHWSTDYIAGYDLVTE